MSTDRVSGFRIHLLGEFRVTQDGVPVAIGPACAKLLAFTAVQSAPPSRATLARALWPDRTPAQADAALRVTVCRLRRVHHDLIDRRSETVRLGSDVTVDLWDAGRLIRLAALSAVPGPSTRMSLLLDDLLPDWARTDWLVVPRERFRQARLDALETLCGRMSAADRHGDAVSLGRMALRSAPLRESTRRVVSEAQRAVGRTCRQGSATVVAAPAAPRPDAATYGIHVLGEFEFRVAGSARRLAAGSRRLLAFLAINGGVATRAAVARRLWPDAPTETALANVRSSLHRLAEVRADIVTVDRDGIRLTGAVAVDLDRVSAVLDRLLDPSSSGAVTGLATRDLEGDILPDWPDDWLAQRRERHRARRLHGLETLASWLLAEGRLGAAVDTALAAAHADPYRNSIHEILIRAHLRAGNRVEARRHLAEYRRRLRVDLGLAVPSELERLVHDAP